MELSKHNLNTGMNIFSCYQGVIFVIINVHLPEKSEEKKNNNLHTMSTFYVKTQY